jgi:hypothetical protein
MKTTGRQDPNFSGTRRNFLKSAGVLTLATPAVITASPKPMPETAQWWHGRGRLELLAEGLIPIDFVLPPLDPPPALPPNLAPRLRATFPKVGTKDVLAVQVYLAPLPPQGTVPLETPPPPIVPDPNPTFSYFEMKVSAVELSCQPDPNLTLLGRVLVNAPAMFGDMTGAGFALTTGFMLHEDTPTDFFMLGAHVPGHHTTIAPEGHGTLIIR